MTVFLGPFVFPALFILFVAATLVQMLAWLILFSPFARFLTRSRGAAGREPITIFQPVSLVVCARNEADNLRRHLPLWLAQHYAADWELLVVDDASDDDTAAVLAFFQANNPRLRVLRITKKQTPGKKAALAQGVAAARYEQLVLTDADCAPASTDWLRRMAAGLTATPETDLVLGYAPLYAGPGLLNRWARFETAYTAVQYFAFARIGMPYMGVGRNLAWKRLLFRQAGGFAGHTDLPSGDDDLLVNAVARPGRVALCLSPATFVYSAAKTTWGAWLRQKRRQLGSGLRYRPMHQLTLGGLAASHTFHYFLGVVILFIVAAGLGPTPGLPGFQSWFVGAGWGLRLAVVWPVWRRVLRGFGEKRLLAWVPLLDILLAIYYAGFVPLAFLRGKRAPWK